MLYNLKISIKNKRIDYVNHKACTEMVMPAMSIPQGLGPKAQFSFTGSAEMIG